MDPTATVRRQLLIEELRELSWLKHVEWLAETDSTNNFGRRWLASNARDLPALFVADRQTAGRGRDGSQWWSPDGCLMFTLAICASELPNDRQYWPSLSLVAGLSVADAVDSLLGHSIAQLKWPNDVFVQDRKLAGILIESSQVGQSYGNCLIGIGINVHNDWAQAPPEIQRKATCLSTIAGEGMTRESTLLEVLTQLQSRFEQWRSVPQSWHENWQRRCLLNNKLVEVRLNDQNVFSGLCLGVSESGQLLLQNELGIQKITAGEILSW